ncbi:MAG: hypothetical protein AAF902_21265 [Chloroflexota bacterium]
MQFWKDIYKQRFGKQVKTWDEIYSDWQTANVPDIKQIPFDINLYPYALPWYNKEGQYQADTNNPQKRTAFHLINYLQDKPKELIAAYKILAATKHYDCLFFLSKVLIDVFNKYDENVYGWWNGNAKYLLPTTKLDYDFRVIEYSESIPEAIELSIQKWRELHNEWQLIRLPNLLDIHSSEFIQASAEIERRNNEQEYREYLRLKKKFEDKD